MQRPLLIALVSAWLLTGCAESQPPTIGNDHPASPDAPAAQVPSGQTEATHQHAGGTGHAAGTESAATYVCPMHPEVTASGPEKCPKCGMTLVKKDSGGTSHEGH